MIQSNDSLDTLRRCDFCDRPFLGWGWVEKARKRVQKHSSLYPGWKALKSPVWAKCCQVHARQGIGKVFAERPAVDVAE